MAENSWQLWHLCGLLSWKIKSKQTAWLPILAGCAHGIQDGEGEEAMPPRAAGRPEGAFDVQNQGQNQRSNTQPVFSQEGLL